MQQIQKLCTLQIHHGMPIVKYCIFPQCQLSRFLCILCIENGIHQHDQQNHDHILDPEIFTQRVEANIQISMIQEQEHQHNEGDQNANGMTDLEKIDKSNIIFKELQMIKQMEQFGLDEGDNRLLLQKLRKTQKSIREMIEFQYKHYEAHIPPPQVIAPNQELIELRQEEQQLQKKHKAAYDKLGDAMKHFLEELKKRCEESTNEMRQTIEGQFNVDFVNKVVDEDFTYQEKVGELLMKYLEKNNVRAEKQQQELNNMIEMYKQLSRKVKQGKQTVHELLQAKRTVDQNKQLQ